MNTTSRDNNDNSNEKKNDLAKNNAKTNLY